MERAVSLVKKVRHNWWEGFKDFWRIKGYHYYEMPKELKYRYPAPGSWKLTEEDRPYLFKNDWRNSFKDSPYNIRDKHKPVRPFDKYDHYADFKDYELDPSKPTHQAVLAGPIRNRERWPKPYEFLGSTYDPVKLDRKEFGAEVRQAIAEHENLNDPDHETYDDNMDLGYQDTVYRPQFMLFYERGATGIENDKRIQHMLLEIEYQIEEVVGKEAIETKKMDMYKGTVKKWQVLDDHGFARDQIEKVQKAIKAPSPDELERYREENQEQMTLPITNSNVSQWRDKKRAIDTTDFNAKMIEFERKRHENFFLKRYEKQKELE